MGNFVNLGTLTPGDDVIIALSLVDEDGAALDITGVVSIKFQLNRNGTPVVAKELLDGITVTDEATGELEIALAAADTEELIGGCDYEVELVDVDGKYRTPIYGAVGFRPALIANESS